MLETIDSYLTEKRELISLAMQEVLKKHLAINDPLYKSSHYALSSGKRLRSILVLAILETFNKEIYIGIIPALSLELIHGYSLIHDDLPCMDDDDMRRSKPSLHKAFPEWLALLTGDFLLTFAFELLSNASIDDKTKVKLIQVLTQNAGAGGMIQGQVIDLMSVGMEIDWPTLKKMHDLKTGKLIRASISFGAILAGASKKEELLLDEFGKKLGLAFQVLNDIQDAQESRNSDQKQNKPTAVTLLGVDKAQELVDASYEEIQVLLDKLPNPYLLKEFTKKILF